MYFKKDQKEKAIYKSCDPLRMYINNIFIETDNKNSKIKFIISRLLVRASRTIEQNDYPNAM